MSRYPRNIITKTTFTPTGPATNGSAPGIWTLSEAAYWTKQGLWPNASIQASDTYFPYVSLLLSTTSLGNANNNLFVDSSGAFSPVSRFGNTTQGSFTPYSTNWSNYFDGTSDSLTYTGGSSLNFGTSDFTIELWAFLTNTGTYSPFIRPDDSGSFPEFGYDFSSGQLKFDARNAPIVSVTTTMPTNQWVHVAASRSGTSLRLFVNGTQVGSTTTNSTNFGSTTGAIRIGGSSFSASHTVNGYLSNLRVVKGTAVYTANFTVPTSPLTAITNTSLLTCQSNRFRDASTNNYTITRNGDTRVTDFGPFNPTYPGAVYNQSDITNWSGYFDGSGDYLQMPSNAAFAFGTGDYTIEGWIYVTVGGLNQRITWFSDDRHNIDLNTSNQIFLYDGAIRTFGTVTVGTWNHFAVSRSGGTVSCYLNGVRGYNASETTNSSTRSMNIAANNAGNGYFNGYISNIRVVKGTGVYSGATITVPTTNLTAISGTSLLTLQNAAFTDNSTNNFVITQNGNPTVTGNSPFNTVGYWSVLFNGSNNWLAASANTATTLGTGNFTIEGWFFTSYNSANQVIIEQAVIDEGSGNNTGWILYLGTSNNIVFGGAAGQTYINAAPSTSFLGRWTHFALVRTSTTSITLYINGVSIGSTSTNVNMSAALDVRADTPTLMGSHELQLAGSFFNGYLSNIRIVKGTAVYTSNFTPPTSPLTAISGTGLLTLQSSRLIDNSGNNITVASTFSSYSGGSPAIQPFDPFYTATIASNGGSMYFDGAGDQLFSPRDNRQIGNFTVECWIYLNAISGYPTFYAIGNESAGRISFQVTGGSLQYNVYGGGNVSLGGSLTTGQWSHIAFVRNGTIITGYVNGAPTGSATLLNILGNANGSYISGISNGNDLITGYISNLRVTTGIALYTTTNTAFTPPTAPLTPTANTTLLVNGMNAGIYDATAINGMETVGNAQVTTVQSKFGGSSMYFDGSGDWLRSPASFSNRVNTTGNFTIEFWAYFNSVAAGQCLITWDNNSTDRMIMLYTNLSGNLAYYLSSSGSSWDIASDQSVGSISTGSWYHVALVRNGSSFKPYLNGTAGTATTSSSALYLSTLPLIIGSGINQFGGGQDPFNGYIDDLRITKGVARYTANFTPPTQAFPTY